jgi:CubicO group peptidase (beta-lactamase class C family)
MGEAIKAVIADLSIDGEFNPHDKLNIPATEYREDLKRRIQGEVHDENALAMGGIAPHAGLFMSASDLVKFGEALRTGKVLTPKALAEATSKIVTDGAVSRGLGFALATPGATRAHGALSPSSYGHYGFTGTSLWIDPERALVAVLLTNRVFYGRSSNTAISDSRKRFHELAISLTSATI